MLQAIRLPPRRALAMIASTLLASTVLLSACERELDRKRPQEAAPAPLPPPAPPLQPPSIGRSDLLTAISAARAAYAGGQPDTSDSLAGRRFVIRQGFGCAGPAPAASPTTPRDPAGVAHWSRGPDQKSIEIALIPADWVGAPVLAGETAEAAEGYWLTRPWFPGEGCPGPRTTSAPLITIAGTAPPPLPSPAPLVSGVVAVFTENSSRVRRRDGKPFTMSLRGDAALAPVGGYRLVIEGRFSAFSDGQVIRCIASNPDEVPVCVAAVEVDRVAFEDADGKLLTEWRQG